MGLVAFAASIAASHGPSRQLFDVAQGGENDGVLAVFCARDSSADQSKLSH